MYTKQVWHTGDVIIDSKLNHIEQGVADSECKMFMVNVGVVGGTPNTYIPDMTFAEVMAKINDGYLPIYKFVRDDFGYSLIESYNGTEIVIMHVDDGPLKHDSTGVHIDSGWEPN